MDYLKERKAALGALILLLISIGILCFSYLKIDYDSKYIEDQITNIGKHLSLPLAMLAFMSLVFLTVFLGAALISHKLGKSLMMVFTIVAILVTILIFVAPYTYAGSVDVSMTFGGILSGILIGISAILLLLNSQNVYEDYE